MEFKIKINALVYGSMLFLMKCAIFITDACMWGIPHQIIQAPEPPNAVFSTFDHRYTKEKKAKSTDSGKLRSPFFQAVQKLVHMLNFDLHNRNIHSITCHQILIFLESIFQ